MPATTPPFWFTIVYIIHTRPLPNTISLELYLSCYRLGNIVWLCIPPHSHLGHHCLYKFENVFRLNSDVQSACKTRHSNLVHSGRCDSVFSSKLPLYNFPCVWNKYNHIFQSDTYSHNPKTRMKNYFLSAYLESVKCTNCYCKQCF